MLAQRTLCGSEYKLAITIQAATMMSIISTRHHQHLLRQTLSDSTILLHQSCQSGIDVIDNLAICLIKISEAQVLHLISQCKSFYICIHFRFSLYQSKTSLDLTVNRRKQDPAIDNDLHYKVKEDILLSQDRNETNFPVTF